FVVVGIMTASEVPTAMCMRISGGMPTAVQTSYSTGTRMAPPPMPNNPARNPDIRPPAPNASASSTTAPVEIPVSMRIVLCGRAARLWIGLLHGRKCPHQRLQSVAVTRIGAAQMPAEKTPPGLGMIESEQVPGHVVQFAAACQVPLDVGDQLFDHLA